MLGVFVALIGLAYAGCKMLEDKSVMNNIKSEKAERKKLRDYVWPKIRTGFVKDGGGVLEETEVEVFICTKEKHEKIYKMLEDDLKYVFGEDYRQYFDLNECMWLPWDQRFKCRADMKSSSAYWAKQLILSKYGKCTDDPLFSGYLVIGYFHNEQVKMCKCIERNLKKFVPEVNFRLDYYDTHKPSYGFVKFDFCTIKNCSIPLKDYKYF